MGKRGPRQLFSIFVLLGAAVTIDQLSKYQIRQAGGFYICNPGVAFGITLPATIFWSLGVGAIIIVGRRLFQQLATDSRESFFLLLILGGSLSNMLDRLLVGCITDFIDLRIWPVFNLADIMVFLGAAGLLVKWLKYSKID